jgi:phosphoribosylamine--glycine ligase
MRFLGVTETCDLGSLYWRLIEERHEVKVFIEEPKARGTMAGIVPRTVDWQAELVWIREAGEEGILIFEAVSEGLGERQDQLRKEGYNVIGGSALGDRLENDRAFAFERLERAGLQTASAHEFHNFDEAESFLAQHPGRYVLKFSGPNFASSDNYVGQLPDGRDVLAYLRSRLEKLESGSRFILMEFVNGIEMGVGAYFNGERFLEPACLDWEHKRFFVGDLGELTGEMGTVATYRHSASFFERTLKAIEPDLKQAGHVGYVNLNTIVNEAGIFPLEFTCRFGYPGFAVLEPLQALGWGELFRTMVRRDKARFPVHRGFSVGIVLTTPPFPYSVKQVEEPVGLPVNFRDPLDLDDLRNIHYGEVGMEADQLVTSGLYGWTMVVTGVGNEIRAAQREAYRRAGNVSAPNLRYRLDIGDKLAAHEWARLLEMGFVT